jgi:hypothetical protein
MHSERITIKKYFLTFGRFPVVCQKSRRGLRGHGELQLTDKRCLPVKIIKRFTIANLERLIRQDSNLSLFSDLLFAVDITV